MIGTLNQYYQRRIITTIIITTIISDCEKYISYDLWYCFLFLPVVFHGS